MHLFHGEFGIWSAAFERFSPTRRRGERRSSVAWPYRDLAVVHVIICNQADSCASIAVLAGTGVACLGLMGFKDRTQKLRRLLCAALCAAFVTSNFVLRFSSECTEVLCPTPG